jgi:hypothetical protein
MGDMEATKTQQKAKGMNTPSLCLAVNFYNDAAALRGLLELGSRCFDHIFTINAGPGGARSTDGSIELAESFGATVVFDDIQKGFGRIRTRLLHECGCEWAVILDADERIFPQMYVMTCEGSESYPSVAKPNLVVTVKSDVIDQLAHLRNLISNPGTMAVRATRRHWFDHGMKRPSQNWYGPFGNKDHQLRIVRNRAEIGYQRDRVMHERLIDERTGKDPVFAHQDEHGGVFIDHFHLFYRRTQPGKKEANEKNYERLSRGEPMIV